MYAVMVKPTHRNFAGTNGKIWVKDVYSGFYCKKSERGLWKTRAEAQRQVTEDYEIVVDVSKECLKKEKRNETAKTT